MRLNRKLNRYSRWILTLSLLLATSPLFAEKREEIDRSEYIRGRHAKTGLSLGGAVFKIKTQARANSKTIGIGPVIDFENFLGMDDRDEAFFGRFFYRFTPKHKLDVSFYQVTRTGKQVIDDEIEWNGEIIPVNTDTFSSFDVGLLSFNYGYSFFHNQDVEIGFVGGLSIFDFDSTLFGDIQGTFFDETVAETIPLPLIGFFTTYSINPKLFLDWKFQFFLVKYDKYSGNLSNISVGMEYYPWKRFGFAGSITNFRIDVEVEPEDREFNGEITYRTVGASLNIIILLGKSQ